MVWTIKRQVWGAILVSCLLFSACNFAAEPGETPLAEAATASLTPSATATATLAAPTATRPPLSQITPAPSSTPVTPSMTPTITDTPGPIEHILQPGDQLIAIVQEYGHTSLAVLDLVVTMNPNIPSRDILPPPGSVILIPRPTATATPPGGELTATVVAQNPPTATPPMLTEAHVVEEGQTMAGIAVQYNTTLQILRNLNPPPDVSWAGCDFSIASGGEGCSPLVIVGQTLIVPMPTPTPTLSPTPSGSETPTPTPTPAPVRLLWPAPGDIVVGGPLVLRWVSSGILGSDDLYQVSVADITSGLRYTEFTTATVLTLPGELQPTDASPHQMTWQVEVVRVGSDNVAFAVGAPSEQRPFQWQATQ